MANQTPDLGASMAGGAFDGLSSQLEKLKNKVNETIDPIGSLHRKVDELTSSLQKKNAAMDIANRGSRTFLEHLKGIGQAFLSGNIGSGMAQLGRSIGAIGGSVLKTVGVALAAPAAILAIGMAIQGLVAKANPAAAFQFNLALSDLAGTMGQILTPVLRGITVFIRAFADGLQGLRPALDPIMQGLGDTIRALAPLMQSLMQMAGPALQTLGLFITEIVVPAIRQLADTLNEFFQQAMRAAETLTGGLLNFSDFKAKSSFGAAIRPAQYSSIEEIGKRTTLAALNQSDRDNVPRKIDRTNDLLAKILEKVGVDKSAAGTISKFAKFANPVNAVVGVGEWFTKKIRDL